jgi:hypothetical protein
MINPPFVQGAFLEKSVCFTLELLLQGAFRKYAAVFLIT